MIRDRRRSASNYTSSYNGLIEVLGLTHDHFGVVAIANDNLNVCIRRGGWALFDLILIRLCECHVVYTTKKTASSAGATITEGHCYICSFHFGTEIPKVFCIEEIVVVLVYQ